MSDSLLRKDFFAIDNGIRFLYARKFCRRPTVEVSASEQSRFSASVERAVLVYTSQACKYSITSAVVMAAAVTCSSAIVGNERFTSAYARQVYEQMMAYIQSRNWNFTIETYKTRQFNESRLFICRIKSEHICSGENARNMHVSWMMLEKQVALKIFKC